MFTSLGMFYLGIYLIICYLIIVGVHKRKNGHYYYGPFSKTWYKKRELVLIIISFLVFIIFYYYSCAKYLFKLWNSFYIAEIKKNVLLDLIRVIISL